METKKIAIVGFGKRVQGTILNVLRLHPGFKIEKVFTRTDRKRSIIKGMGFSHGTDLASTNPNEYDVILIAAPTTSKVEILNSLTSFKGIILVETPVATSLVKTIYTFLKFRKLDIFYLEQFPYLPSELSKKNISKLLNMGKVIYAENINRTFGYHGLAQLRSYFPSLGKIKSLTTQRLKVHEDLLNFGLVKFENGIFQHSFSESLKKSTYRDKPVQKIFFDNGSISNCLVKHKSGGSYVINLDISNTTIPPDHFYFKGHCIWSSNGKTLTASQHGIYEVLTLLHKGNYPYGLKEATLDTLLNKIISFDQKYRIKLCTYFLCQLYNAIQSSNSFKSLDRKATKKRNKILDSKIE